MLSREVVKLCFTDIGNNNTDPRILHDTARAQVATYYLGLATIHHGQRPHGFSWL